MLPRRLFGLLLLVAILAASSNAWAHASLLSSAPADGAVVPAAPSTLSLTFNEPVAPTVFSLIAPDGKTVEIGKPVTAGDNVSVTAPSGLATGSYALSWRVISADGHPVGGTIVFAIGAPSAGGAPPSVAADTTPLPLASAIWLTRAVTYVALLGGVGGGLFAAWIERGIWRRGLFVLLIVGLLALPLDIVFEGLDALGQPLGGVFRPEPWAEGLGTSYGGFVLLALGALVVAGLSLWLAGAQAKLVSLIGLFLLGIAFASTGHAATADPQWLTRPAVFLHTTALAFWIGSLLPLAGLLRQPAPAALPGLQRFSTFIPYAVALLLLSGIGLAVVQVVAPGELLATDYGKVLIGKLALVGLLLLLAALNRWRLTKPVLAGDAARRRQLAGIIATEMALAMLVFGVVALWRFTPPPRALLAAEAVPASVHIHTDQGMAELTLTPGHAGPVDAKIYVMNADFGPLPAKGVTLSIGNNAMGIEPISRDARPAPDGSWTIDPLTLPAGGNWQVELDVLVSDFQVLRLRDQIYLRP